MKVIYLSKLAAIANALLYMGKERFDRYNDYIINRLDVYFCVFGYRKYSFVFKMGLSKIFLLTVPRRYFFYESFVFLCHVFLYFRAVHCSLLPFGHLLGKD